MMRPMMVLSVLCFAPRRTPCQSSSAMFVTNIIVQTVFKCFNVHTCGDEMFVAQVAD